MGGKKDGVRELDGVLGLGAERERKCAHSVILSTNTCQ